MKIEKCRMCNEEFDEKPQSYCNCRQKYHKTCMEKLWLTRFSHTKCKFCAMELKTASRQPNGEEIEARKNERKILLLMYLPVVFVWLLITIPVYYVLKFDVYSIKWYIKTHRCPFANLDNFIGAVLCAIFLLFLLMFSVFFILFAIVLPKVIAEEVRKKYYINRKVYRIIDEENSSGN